MLKISIEEAVYNPDGFEPANFLPKHLMKYIDGVRYLIHFIHRKSNRLKKKNKQFVNINNRYISDIIGRDKFKEIRNILIDQGIIEIDGIAIEGKKSYGFRITEKYFNKKFKIYPIINPKLIKKLKNLDIKYQNDNDKHDVYDLLNKNLTEVGIEYNNSKRYAKKNYSKDPNKYYSLVNSIEMIKDKYFYFHLDKYGRVHTNISNIRSDVRQFLLHKKERLVEIDIVNTQPLLLGLISLNELFNMNRIHNDNKEENSLQKRIDLSIIKEKEALLPPLSSHPNHFKSSISYLSPYSSSYKIPYDVHYYMDLVQKGTIYDYFRGKFPNKQSRKGMKYRFFVEVMFSKNEVFTDLTQVFKEMFPNVYKAITHIKRFNHCELAHRLQRAESDLMLLKIAYRAFKQHPGIFLATIHDSFLTHKEDVDKVSNILKEEFQIYGVMPTILVKDYT